MSQVSAIEEYDQVIAEHLRSQDNLEFELGDTLDIKTSIFLVVIIFLATQSGGFLESRMPLHWHYIQMVSVGCIILAGVLAVLELRPKKYKAGMDPSEFIGWIKEMKTVLSQSGVLHPERQIVEEIRSREIEKTEKRFAKNMSLNASKSWKVKWLFRFVVAGLTINLATLMALSSGWRF